jgi:RNA polymerase sigma-70 factor (ECF subfamily)
MWFLGALATRTKEREVSNDAAWISRAAEGDESALAALYDGYARAVFSLAARILSDQADAEDVVQEVFAQAWRQARRYDAQRGTVAAWLLNMARTRAIDRLRTRRARPDTAGDTPADAWDVLPASVVDPGDALGAARDAEKVRHALEELPLLQRLVIELAYFEGLTHSEIAERLEQPLGTIKTRIRTGLLKLRDALSGNPAGGPA